MLGHAAPILLGLAAALTWGGADFTGGLAARRGRPGTVVFIAHSASLAVLAVLVWLTHPAPLTGFSWVWGLLSGASGGVALMLFYEALATGAMGLSAALAGVLTAALPVAVSLVRQGWPGRWQLAGFLVAAVAIGLIAWSPELPPEPSGTAQASQPPATTVRSLAFSTVAGLGFGLQLVVLHLASAQGSVLRALTLSRIGGTGAGAAAMLLAAGLRHRAVPQEAPSASSLVRVRTRATGSAAAGLVALALLTGLLDTTGNGLYMGAALAGRLDVAAVLASLYPGSTILLAVWILKERTTRLQAAGMLLALLAVALISA